MDQLSPKCGYVAACDIFKETLHISRLSMDPSRSCGKEKIH